MTERNLYECNLTGELLEEDEVFEIPVREYNPDRFTMYEYTRHISKEAAEEEGIRAGWLSGIEFIAAIHHEVAGVKMTYENSVYRERDSAVHSEFDEEVFVWFESNVL